MREALTLAGTVVQPGQRGTGSLRIPRLYTRAELDIPVHILHGRRAGPTLFVSAVIHGDEINGVEIIRRLLRLRVLRKLSGTLIAVPVVNAFGFISQSRYLPDRRDLNRSFPGSKTGSLAARVADLFVEEIVARSTHGVDLHTGSNHRINLPQIRACLDDPETARLARAFGAPVVLDANTRDGSLRQEGVERAIPMLLYEAGEALRFNEFAIRAGQRGVVRVMRSIGMLPPQRQSQPPTVLVARASSWFRAPISGIVHGGVSIGQRIVEGQLLGTITDPVGDTKFELRASVPGVVIGALQLPLVHQGDALFHIARLADEPGLAAALESLRQELRPEES